MKIAIGAIKRAWRPAKAEVGQFGGVDAIAGGVTGQQVFGVTGAGVVDILFGAAGHIHRQGQGMGDFFGRQLHGDRGGDSAGQGAGLAFVVEAAFALPGFDEGMNGVHHIIADR